LGLVHLILLVIRLIRAADAQSRGGAPPGSTALHNPSAGEAVPRPTHVPAQAQQQGQVRQRPSAARTVVAARPPASIVEDAPSGPVEWMMRLFEGRRA
jgi:hypothetical protein